MVLLAGLSIQQCTIGCLRCNNLNQCQLCDTSNNYYLQSNTCILSTLTNCNIISQSGNCIQCNANFYMDLNAQRCVSVAQSSVIANCATYNNGQTCIACSGNFFLRAGACLAINSTIANCQTYNSLQQCAACASGYVVNTDNSACVAVPQNSTCRAYTYIGCRSCRTGFVSNQNLYFTNMNTASWLSSFFLPTTTTSTYDWVGLLQCQAVAITNCLVYSTFNFCQTCAPNFYLQNGQCIAYPLPVIFGCLNYSSLTTCSACQSGYFLNNNQCLVNSVIVNCAGYLGSASSTTCSLCNNGFYLQGNVCVNRTMSVNIANCQQTSITADLCATCATGFIMTTDNRACLPAISNCQTYSTGSSFQSTALQCSLCNNGFYLTTSGSTTVCVAGTTQFCQTYQVNANVCTACQNGYYLSNSNTCIQHVNIANCATYDPTRANYCSVCASGYYNFGYTSVCVQTTVIANCLSYSSDGNTCTKCAAGFYVNSGSCTIIPTTYANCATFSGSQCTLCNTGYMVNTLPTVGTCTLPLDYINSTINSPCAVMQTYTSSLTPTWIASAGASQTVLTCGTCNNYMYIYSPLPSEAICVLTTQLPMFWSYSAVTNCIRYGLNYATTQQIVCMQCASGFFISGYQTLAQTATATSCVSSCSLTTSTSASIIVDDMLGFVNICVANGQTWANDGYCARYGRMDFQQTANAAASADYACIGSTPGSSTYPLSFLMYDTALAVADTKQYIFESPSATTPQTARVNGAMYAYPQDNSSLTPTVFNYHGILASSSYGALAAQLIRPYKAADAAITTTNMKTSVANCDILTLHGTGMVGGAYETAATAFTVPTAVMYSCFRCSFGFQANMQVASTVATTFPFPTCAQMSTCASSSTIYGGLTQFLNSILSCHVCGTSNGQVLYPTIYIETDADATQGKSTGNFVSYQVKNVYSVAAAVPAVTSTSGFKCAAAPASVLITDAAATNTGTVTNCAVYGFILPVTTGTAAGLAVGTGYNVCLACAGNYFPTYLGAYSVTTLLGIGANVGQPRWTVTGCTASTNCDTSVVSQFNFCGRCRTDQDNLITPTYYGYIDLTLSNCYKSVTRNCLILSSSSFSTSGTNNCWVCKAGYIMNADGYCEEYRVPNQAVNNGNFYRAYAASQAYSGTTGSALAAPNNINAVRIHYLHSLNRLTYGVNACSIGYTLAPANPWAPKVCVWSSYVYNTTGNFPSVTKFVNNCVRYNTTQSASGNNLCGGCTTGYIPTVDGTSCVSSASITNCVYAQNGANNGLCYQCAVNFMNVNGLCVSGTIPNCAAYVNNQWSISTPGVLTCLTCVDGFVLSGDGLSCTSGQVSNCIQYVQAQPLQCTACVTGFVLMTLNTVWYCYPIPASLNCALLQDTSPTSGANWGTISCASCNANSNAVYGIRQWTALNLVSQPQTLCMPFTVIANCQTYSQSNAIIRANTFSCTQCNANFWFSASNSTCVPRANMPSQCLNYTLTADTCTLCSSGFFLSADATNCIAFPNGIFQCRLYSAATTCTQCNAGYYLSNNLCLASTLINNCITYSANFTCSACASSFFLNNATSCITATAANCLTYSSINVCASCATGFGLQTSNGVTSCVAVNLPNCVNATTVAPFTCLICSTGFFPNSNGVCTAVSSIIANCLTYDTATTCSRCQSNSILNVLRNVCNTTAFNALIDPNCDQNFLLSQPVCTQCSLGSYFVNGTCSSCTNNTFSSGCGSCDALNNNVCLFCRPNYYMNAQGGCVANNPTPVPTPTPTPNNGTSSAVSTAVKTALALAIVFFDRA